MTGTGRQVRGLAGARHPGQRRPGVRDLQPGRGRRFTPWAIVVLEFSGGSIAGLHHFIYPELFAQFGLPERLERRRRGPARPARAVRVARGSRYGPVPAAPAGGRRAASRASTPTTCIVDPGLQTRPTTPRVSRRRPGSRGSFAAGTARGRETMPGICAVIVRRSSRGRARGGDGLALDAAVGRSSRRAAEAAAAGRLAGGHRGGAAAAPDPRDHREQDQRHAARRPDELRPVVGGEDAEDVAAVRQRDQRADPVATPTMNAIDLAPQWIGEPSRSSRPRRRTAPRSSRCPRCRGRSSRSPCRGRMDWRSSGWR